MMRPGLRASVECASNVPIADVAARASAWRAKPLHLTSRTRYAVFARANLWRQLAPPAREDARNLRKSRHMSRTFFMIGALLALVAVAAGAFGAHGLRGRLEPELLTAWETGARYGLYHALALLIVALALARWPGAWWHAAGWLFVAGGLTFSGSLYALALTGARWLGALTPVGGLLLLLGWLTCVAAAWRHA